MSYHKRGDNRTEEAQLQPAVLYQPLGEGVNGDRLAAQESAVPLCEAGSVIPTTPCARDVMIKRDGRGERYHAPGSRCEQYGGYWVGHKCKGLRGGGSANACDIIGWITIVGGPFIPEATALAKGVTIVAGGTLKEVCG